MIPTEISLYVFVLRQGLPCKLCKLALHPHPHHHGLGSLSASASWVAGLQVYTTKPSYYVKSSFSCAPGPTLTLTLSSPSLPPTLPPFLSSFHLFIYLMLNPQLTVNSLLGMIISCYYSWSGLCKGEFKNSHKAANPKLTWWDAAIDPALRGRGRQKITNSRLVWTTHSMKLLCST